MKLTREEALKLHGQMWEDMQKKLGENPSIKQRGDFKIDWINFRFKNGSIDDNSIENNCFLCEYALQTRNEGKMEKDKWSALHGGGCLYCPIDWSNGERGTRYYACEMEKTTWCDSPISEILALPERRTDE